VLWVALDECVRRVVGRTIDHVPSRLRRKLGRVARRRTAPLVVPAMTAGQVAELYRTAAHEMQGTYFSHRKFFKWVAKYTG
jgi:hypothetical protein